LYASKEVIEKRALKTLKSYGNGSGHIFNLGHGILPDIDPDNLKTLVNFVKENSSQFHN
jgi:uroporphyrinogen decarboxylase